MTSMDLINLMLVLDAYGLVIAPCDLSLQMEVATHADRIIRESYLP
jgi:hypothetical protein